MEQKDNKKSHFNMSEDISQISIVDSSKDENIADGKSQSQSLLNGISMENSDENGNSEKMVEDTSQSQSLLHGISQNNSSEIRNSEKMDVAEEYSEELFSASPGPVRSVLDDLDERAELPKVSAQQKVVSVTDKLLLEAQKASRNKPSLTSDIDSDNDEDEPNDDSIMDDNDILGNDDSIRNYVKDLGNEDSNRNNVDNLENENSNKEQSDDSDKIEDSENIEDIPSPEVDAPADSPADSELIEDVENDDSNSKTKNVEKSKENETEKEDATEDLMTLENQLPLSKIRKIIKGDAENNLIVSKEAIYVASIAAELFIANVTQQTAKITHANKKKTVSLAHLKAALSGSESFDFLEGCFPDIY